MRYNYTAGYFLELLVSSTYSDMAYNFDEFTSCHCGFRLSIFIDF